MIIAFTGKKLCGKTEASKCLEEFTKLNFKDALVREIRNGFPKLLDEICRAESQLLREHFTVEKLFEKKPPLMRVLMQNYGTDIRRKEAENYWVDRYSRVARYRDDNICTDDVRFLNEAKTVKDLGGIIVRIERPGLESTDSHISEQEMEQIEADYTIINNGTIEELCKKVYGIQGIPENS